VHIIKVYKTRGNEPPILPVMFNMVGIQDPFIINILVVPGVDATGNGYD
jgi:hypothetical protein